MAGTAMNGFSGEKSVEMAVETVRERRVTVSKYIEYIPEEICNTKTQQTYSLVRYLGKGSYAKCYEVKHTRTGNKYACKIHANRILSEPKLSTTYGIEIAIHSSLSHENIAQFSTEFSDQHNLYMLTELCPFKTLNELVIMREGITEVECRYYMHGILAGVQYLHQMRVVHRDLKLSNVFLGQNLQPKIGDFGLAAQITTDDGLLRTTCGTTNYFAPEIVRHLPYSYEVDVWCIGIMMYILLVGHTPFAGDTLDELVQNINLCFYEIPATVSAEATAMIHECLREDPLERPTAIECSKLEFIHDFIIPKSLPVYSLLIEPKPEDIPFDNDEHYENFLNPGQRIRTTINSMFAPCQDRNLIDLRNLCETLQNVTNRKTRHWNVTNIAEDHKIVASKLWVKKWIYEPQKCTAFGWQLTDDSLGILFTDKTKFRKRYASVHMDYIDANSKKARLTVAHRKSVVNFNAKLKKFRRFKLDMDKLVKPSTYGTYNPYKTKTITNARNHSQAVEPSIHSWFTTAESIVMYLTNGIVQINFVDHFKLIMDSRAITITFIEHKHAPKTISSKEIDGINLSADICSRLKFASVKIKYLMAHLKKANDPRRQYLY